MAENKMTALFASEPRGERSGFVRGIRTVDPDEDARKYVAQRPDNNTAVRSTALKFSAGDRGAVQRTKPMPQPVFAVER